MPYKQNGRWYTDIRPRVLGVPTGKRVRKLMPKVKTKQAAEEEERRVLRDIQAHLSGERIASPIFEDYAKGDFLRWVRANKKRAAEDKRHIEILCSSPYFQGKRLDDINPEAVERFKAERAACISNRGKRLAAGTVNGDLAVLSCVFRQAIASSKARSNPVLGVNYLPVEASPFRILEYSEEDRLFEALRESKPYLYPLARLALLTGMRLGELLNLRVEDVDFGRDVLYVTDPKWPKDKRRTEGLMFSQEARSVLLGLKVRRGLFFSTPTGAKLRQASVSARFTYQADRVGLDGLTFHSLRHTFGTRLGKKGYPPAEIARLLGHSDIKTTMIYVHPSIADLRAAVESASERPKVIDFEKAGQSVATGS